MLCKQTLNCDVKTKNKCYNLLQEFLQFVKPNKFYKKYIINIFHFLLHLLLYYVFIHFTLSFAALEIFFCLQITLKFLSPALKNKESLKNFRVHMWGFKKSHLILNLIFQKIFAGDITLSCYFHKIFYLLINNINCFINDIITELANKQ